jgi:orotidine-5'-phosphate decarboxylase
MMAAKTAHSGDIRDKLIVALDVPSYDQARALVDKLGDTVNFYKIGLELLFADGLALARELKFDGKRVFLDFKFLDIGNTVERAVASAASLGADFLTLHGHDTKTLKAAAKGRVGSSTKLLAVTVLTSLDEADLKEQGITGTPRDLVLARARLAQDAGIDGVVASGQEAAAIREVTGPDFLIVTPGIRLAGGEAGDQTRVTTPEAAFLAGADHIVVGRPINAATNPREAALAFLDDIARACAQDGTKS